MKITITESKPYCWYVDAIEREFDAHLKIHTTFRYREYILDNTERNREYFKDDGLSLLMLETEHMGVSFLDAATEQKYDKEIYGHEKQVRKELDELDEHFNAWRGYDPNFKD